ncbi:Dynactin, subunit p25 [Rhizoctonia solani]|uniref:Dynactin subunit 5 n=1 Tax=Rhizoctonia solani TaxID=456999 RepID=A0A8H7LJP8_9AGAM|nr:Dynactin, subunit p25 [Rhizoctonia solani]
MYKSRFLVPFLLFSAWVLLLLVSISLPIIKPIYILEVDAKVSPSVQTSIATSIRFGVWGMCLGFYRFGPDGASWDDAGSCTPPRLGYTVDDAILQLTGQKDLAKIALKALMGILILHPIACGLVFLSLLASLVTTWHPVRALNVISLIAVILSAVAATIVFVIDIVLIPIARQKVEEATKNALTVALGNGAWMTLGAVAALWLGVIGASVIACGCFGCGKRRGRRAKKNQYGGAEKLHSLDNGSSATATEMSPRQSEGHKQQGNKVSRRATIAGPQNIILGGKTVIASGAIIRGDLRRTGTGSAVVISLGRYCLISEQCIMRPPYKTYRGNFNYYPMKIGDHVHIGAGTVVEAATIGNHVEIGKNCGKFTIIKDCAKIDDNSIVPPNTVIPALARFGGSPAQFIEELPESTMENVEIHTKGYYSRFQPQEPAGH